MVLKGRTKSLAEKSVTHESLTEKAGSFKEYDLVFGKTFEPDPCFRQDILYDPFTA